MVRSHKRITRKDIRQPDQFITFTNRLLDQFRQHRTVAVIILSLVIALFLALWGWNLYSERQRRLAAQDYSRALTLYHDGKYRAALRALAQAASYSSSTYSRLALLYQANSYVALKQPAKAKAALLELLSKERKETFLRQLAFLTLAYIHEREGGCKEAVGSYSEAEKLHGPFKEEALLGKARCSLQNRAFKEALNAYRKYLSDYPASERVTEISVRIEQIEGKVDQAALGK